MNATPQEYMDGANARFREATEIRNNATKTFSAIFDSENFPTKAEYKTAQATYEAEMTRAQEMYNQGHQYHNMASEEN